jgi:hypothetical protein
MLPTEELAQLVELQRKQTVKWYAKMSGEAEWLSGERETDSHSFEWLCERINTLLVQVHDAPENGMDVR